jgi:hypothetical protein
VHPGRDRCRRARAQGAGRAHRWLPGERTVVAELLVALRHRGLEIGPQAAVGDGNLGSWKALRQVYGAAREQRCWVHKTANILNKLPKARRRRPSSICTRSGWPRPAPRRRPPSTTSSRRTRQYDKAVACLIKDRETLLAFYDFPAEHWKHVRTTNLSRARSPRSACARPRPRATWYDGQRCSWSSSSARAPNGAGGAWTAHPGSPRSFAASSSSMANPRFSTRPDAPPSTTFDDSSLTACRRRR